MHLLATDRLVCPRCGPEFGLILVADRLEARRVHEGLFGCANCREEYPIRGGFGDLRPSPRLEEGASHLLWSDDSEVTLQVAALLGIREGPGFLLLSGSSASHAQAIASMIEEIEIVTTHPGLRSADEAPGVSRIAVGSVLPFRSHTFRGIVLDGESIRSHLEEGARTLAIGGRLVVLDPTSGAAAEIREMGFDLLLEVEAALVGVRTGR
jgi:uncharacterized protein YbaR (Trm112 family)